MTDFNSSKTKENLLKAFAGESQARNRYTFAASAAKKEGYSILQDEFSGQEIEITASYPVEVETSTLKLLRLAERDENNEGVNVYPEFSRIAKDEGFPDIAILFSNVASVENVHSKRFKKYADRLENGSLFKDTATSAWMCTNCGFIYEGQVAPAKCPVCAHTQGFFIKFDESSFEGK